MPDTYQRLVRLDDGALTTYADRLVESGQLVAPDWTLPVYPADHRTFVEFITIANALNFAFTDFVTGEKYAVEWDGTAWSGATGMFAALMRARREGIDILDPHVLRRLTLKDVALIFQPAKGSPEIPLLAERAAFLNAMGASLGALERRDNPSGRADDAVGLLWLMDWSRGPSGAVDAGRLVEAIVSSFAPYAGDRFLHPTTKDLCIFDKRARLLVVMYEGRARASNGELETLGNLERIGPIADYQLPRVLRANGVLVYAPALADLVDQGTILPAGSEEELAVREATCAAIERLLVHVNAEAGTDQPLTMVELDYVLWASGRNAPGRHHLTPTTAY